MATQDLDKLMQKSELPPRSCLHAQIIHSHVVPYHCTVMGAPGSADRDHLPLALVLGLLAEIALEELHRSAAKPHCSGLALHFVNALCFMTWPSSHLGQSERPGCTQPVNNGQPIDNWDIWV